MPSFLDKCEEYFESRDFYTILGLKRTASEKEIKKAYHKLSLLVHPDRVSEDEKTLATEKFKVLARIHTILQNKEKRSIYDDTGDLDDEENDNDLQNWMNYWSQVFKPITKEDIDNYKEKYIGSEDEMRDIKKSYVNFKGDIDKMLDMIQFSDLESIPRFKKIIQEWVDKGEVESYDMFFKEPKGKTKRRLAKWERSRKEFEELEPQLEELHEAINARRIERRDNFFDMVSRLEKEAKGGKRSAVITFGDDEAGSAKKRRTGPKRKAKK